MIDTSDIREMTKEDFAQGRKNPYAEKIKKYGYTIKIHYSPEYVSEMTKNNVTRINNMEDMEWLDLDPVEIEVLKKYREANKESEQTKINQ